MQSSYQVSSAKKLLLYHQTDPQAAAQILSTQKMIRGLGGKAGGGIYFALTAKSTDNKAHHTGVILSALVTIENPLVLHSIAGLAGFTYTQLKSLGYDSVQIKCSSSGDEYEYVIYNWSKVTDIKLVSCSDSNFTQKYAKLSCPHGAGCYRKDPNHWQDFHPPGSQRSFKISSQCEYGNNCYRTDPKHLQKWHSQTQPNPNSNFNSFQTGSTNTSNSGSCQHGNNCFRQNPQHISAYHPPGFIPAPRP